MIGYQCSPGAVRVPVTSSSVSANQVGYHSSASSPTSSVASSSSSVSSSSSINNSASNNSTASSNPSSASRSPISSNLLDYYPEINQDGLNISWFRQANNRALLSEALMTNRMIITGDISLAEMSRYPVPIMVRPPLGVSDITLENWLQEVASSPSQKGLKLTFTSTRTVEPAFRVLARYADSLKGPLILDAEILSWPEPALMGTINCNGQGNGNRNKQQQINNNNSNSSDKQQPVDAWTFLMLCRTRFPNSTISIGWYTPPGCSSPPPPIINHSAIQKASLSIGAAGGPLEVSGSNDVVISSADSMFDLNIIASQHVHLQKQLQNHIQHHHHHHFHPLSHHHILSSSGSLHSSSSGNSSGSPSPTSPISLTNQLHFNQNHHHQNFNHHHHHHPHHPLNGVGSSPPHQVAAAAAAAMAAAVAESFQEMPLNLNINEATIDTTTTTTSTTNNNNTSNSTTRQLPPTSAIISQLQLQQHSGAHIHKKAAMSSSTNSNTPSPQSSIMGNGNVGQARRQSISLIGGNHQQTNQLGLLKTTTTTTSTTMNNQQQNAALNNNKNKIQQQPTCVGYTREMIDKMASLVKEYNLTQPVTFPVEARLLKNSLGELQRLLYQVGPNSTLTIIAKQSDLISVDELISIRKAFSTNQILFDIPDELAASLRQELNLF